MDLAVSDVPVLCAFQRCPTVLWKGSGLHLISLT